MEFFGWGVLILFAALGFTVAAFVVFEFALVHLRAFKDKIAKNHEVMREHNKARADLKRARLAKKRAAMDKLAHRKLDVQIATKQDKSNEKFGTGE